MKARLTAIAIAGLVIALALALAQTFGMPWGI